MAVLACGSNAFRQLADSDDLALPHVVSLPHGAVSLEGACWSQTLIRDGAGKLHCLGKQFDGDLPTSAVKRWLGHDEFCAVHADDEKGTVRRFSGGQELPDAYAHVAMNARDEFLAASNTLHYSKPGAEPRPPALRVYDRLDDAQHNTSQAGATLPLPLDSPRDHASTRPSHRVEALASGAAHFLVLLGGVSGPGRNEVHAWGDSRYGQAGPFPSSRRRGLEDNQEPEDPSELNHLAFFDGLHPDAISCGAFHSAVRVQGGAAYVFGSNKDGQLGIGEAPGSGGGGGAEPVLVELPGTGEEEEVAQLACGGAHTVLLTASGQVWVTGANHDGQLGLGDLSSRRAWVRNTAVEDKVRESGRRIKRVVCTRMSTYFECV